MPEGEYNFSVSTWENYKPKELQSISQAGDFFWVSIYNPRGMELSRFIAGFMQEKGEKRLDIMKSTGWEMEPESRPEAVARNDAQLEFFRVFRITPARLLLFTILGEAKKRGIAIMKANKGAGDRGRGQQRQIREGIIRPIAGRERHFEIRKVPRITEKELREILAKRKPVPEKFRTHKPARAKRLLRIAMHKTRTLFRGRRAKK